MKFEWLTFIRLTEENVKKYAPSSAGVYLLWVKLKNDKWRCYYVGQAIDLEKRLLEHLSTNESNACIRTNISDYISGYECAKVSKQSDRDGIEKYLYDYYKPECNKVDPGGDPVEVNLP